MNLFDLLNQTEFEQMLEEGYITKRPHPSMDLNIYNYTAAAQYGRVWNDSTLTCRGLIADGSGNVIARPYRKFFNYEECAQDDPALTQPFTVTEKMDGSLGILYRAKDGWAIATRGSFDSEQAVRATKILRRDHPEFEPLPGLTHLFEILYPENRIVVDYGKEERLVLLGVLDTETGRDLPSLDGWNGPVVRSFDVSCKPGAVISELGLPDDGTCEGVVLRFEWPLTGPMARIKVKLEEYKRLHRIVTQTSSKTVWEALSQGSDLADLQERVPDEFHVWLKQTIEEFEDRYQSILAGVQKEYMDTRWQLGLDFTRKDFAALAVQSLNKAMLFRLLDGEKIDDMIWKHLKPEYSRPFKTDES